MRLSRGRLITAALLAIYLAGSRPAAAASYQELPVTKRVLYTGIAMVANVVPLVPTFYAPRCLIGYVFCKAAFAAISVLAAADQLGLSGGTDLARTRGILYRGFSGDWFLTGAHVAGDVTPQPLPDPPPPQEEGSEGGAGGGGAGGEEKWVPPPL